VHVDAEVGAGRERDPATVRTRHFDRAAHGRARLGRIPQIAFQQQDRRSGDLSFVDSFGRQIVGCAQQRVHGPLPVRRYQDQAATCRLLGIAGGSVELNARSVEVVAINLAELILRHLADEGGAGAEPGEPRQRIGRCTTGNLAPWPHPIVKLDCTIGVDQPHRSRRQILASQKIVVRIGDDVHDGIADGEHVQLSVGQRMELRED
jgi:hypothetical protein